MTGLTVYMYMGKCMNHTRWVGVDTVTSGLVPGNKNKKNLTFTFLSTCVFCFRKCLKNHRINICFIIKVIKD